MYLLCGESMSTIQRPSAFVLSFSFSRHYVDTDLFASKRVSSVSEQPSCMSFVGVYANRPSFFLNFMIWPMCFRRASSVKCFPQRSDMCWLPSSQFRLGMLSMKKQNFSVGSQ